MGQPSYLDSWEASSIGSTITGSHFGANFIIGVNDSGSGSAFNTAIDAFNLTSIRYPGGTVTETYFDPKSDTWDQLFDNQDSDSIIGQNGKSFATVRSVMELANKNDIGIKFVLPTKFLLTDGEYGLREIDEEALQSLLTRVEGLVSGEYGAARIETFEIGNEYWYTDRMTASEYGAVANRLTQELASIFDEYSSSLSEGQSWQEPDIAVQAGPAWKPGDNEAILDALDADARAEIDDVVVHYYPRNLENTTKFDKHFEAASSWKDETGFGDLKIWTSEWNIRNDPDADHGLFQASSTISAFDEMLSHGVSDASIWGTQYAKLDSRLSWLKGNIDSPLGQQTGLTAPGVIFSDLSTSLPGLQSLNIDPDLFVTGDDTGKLDIQIFGNGDRAVVYIASRSLSGLGIRFDPAGYFNGATHLYAESVFGIDDPTTPDIDESVPNIVETRVVSEFLTGEDISNNEGNFFLTPGEILRIEINFQDSGVNLLGNEFPDSDFPDYANDEFVGSQFGDTIAGFIGNDVLSGMGGNDIIFGGSGDDLIMGGPGSDLAFGDDGNDLIFGGPGSDVMRGGDGDDRLYGGEDDDRLDGGQGNDQIYGGAGNDVIISGEGTNDVEGGSGADLFLISVDGNTIIEDFSLADGDVLGFFGQYETLEQLTDIASVADGENGSSDILISHETGFTTTIIGGGNLFDEILSTTIDFTDSGLDASYLAGSLNDLSVDQIQIYVDSLGTEDLDEQILAVDQHILFANLDPEPAGALLGSLLVDERGVVLEELGEDGLRDLLGNLSDADFNSFVEAFGNQDILESLQYFPSDLADQVEEAVNTADDYEYPEPADDGPDSIPAVEVVDQAVDDVDDETEADFISGSSCFVASAAYRDRNHPNVTFLRWYRDTKLMESGSGRAFSKLYWIVGPILAKPVYRTPLLQKLSRVALSCLVSVLKKWYRIEN